jgi:hypothetical protein
MMILVYRLTVRRFDFFFRNSRIYFFFFLDYVYPVRILWLHLQASKETSNK